MAKPNENTRTTEELREAIRKTEPQHPALDRLRARVVAAEETSTTITSYDRMHHRHSRS
jgi:hypothetical protein